MSQLHISPHNVIHTAEELFLQNGYDRTTLHHIATALDMSVETLEADYVSKERIALTLYQEQAQATRDSVAELADGTVAERYFAVMSAKVEQLHPHEDMVSALFAAAMRATNPQVEPSDISTGTSDPMYQTFAQVVAEASDAPTKEASITQLTMMLYSFHILVILFWLYDRTDEKQATQHFVSFLREFFKMVRPMLVMPMLSKALTKLAQIMMLVFGGARLGTSDKADDSPQAD